MSKTVSAGVVLFNERRELLLCHATETRHWDIPKGMGDPGESARDAALREAREETGLVLDPSRLTDLGQFDYRSDKALHLFGLRTAAGEVDPSTCICTSFFPSRHSGRSIPEMDEFAWIAITDVGRFASGSLNRLFTAALPLAALFDRLPAPPPLVRSGDPA
jgi:8-oxo-dGTP pyrophosphatase MutT (NUDIX family)